MKGKYGGQVQQQKDWRRSGNSYDDELWRAIDAKFEAAIALVRLLPDNAEPD